MPHNESPSAIEVLEQIAKAHGPRDRTSRFGDWLEAVSRYTGFRKIGLLDIACDTANLSHTLFNIEDKTVDPLAIKAIRDTNPSFDFENPPNGDALMGAINAAKGKYFEYKVAERLNSGERVGDIILPDGFRAVLADSANQPGWDIRIVDGDGRVSEFLQLKATDSISYVKDAIERYPDIQILTTDEVASQSLGDQVVLDSDVSDEWLSGVVENAMLEDEAFMDSFLEAFSPIMSLAMIAGTEGFMVLVNRKDMSEALTEGASRTGKTLASQAIAALVYASGAELLALPAGIFSRLVLERIHDLSVASEIIVRSRIEMVQLRLFQQDQILLPYAS